MLALAQDFQKHKAELYQKTVSMVGSEFVLTYSFDNAEKEDLFWQMFQMNFKV